MSKNQAFVTNVKGPRIRIFGASVEKKIMGYLKAVGPLHIHIKVSITFIMMFW